MFYYLKGKLVLKQENFAVLDIGGIGYKIYTSQTSLDSIESEDCVTFYTHVYVREDIFDIYGFTSQDELSMFGHLLSVSGVGPKAALSILSVTSPSRLVTAILTDDAKTLTKAAGVGARVAQRVILELKAKLKNFEILPEDGPIMTEAIGSSNSEEAVSALMVLGYSQNEAQNAVSGADGTLATEEIVKHALLKLM